MDTSSSAPSPSSGSSAQTTERSGASSLHEWNAKAYHQESDPQLGMALAFLATLEMSGDETVLDAGCGSGRVTQHLLERLPNGRVIAMDRSQNMLDWAQEFLGKRFGDKVEYLQGDLQTLCLPERVDGIFSSMVMHFVADHERMFANLYRTLRPQGWLAVQFGASNQPGHMAMEASLRPLLTAEPFGSYLADWQPDFVGSTAASTRTYLRSAGFVDVDVREQQAPANFDRSQVPGFVRTILLREALLKLPSDTLRDQLVNQAVAAINTTGSMEQPWSYIIARARK